MSEGDVLARVTTLEDLARVMVERRHELKLTQILVDEISGLQGGYCAKIEAGMKGLGKLSLPCLLTALGLELAVVRTTPHHIVQGRVL